MTLVKHIGKNKSLYYINIVLLKIKSDTSSIIIQQLISGLKSLTKIDGVLNVSVGPTFTLDRNRGYTHALIVDLRDKSILPLYAQDPGNSFLKITHSHALKHMYL